MKNKFMNTAADMEKDFVSPFMFREGETGDDGDKDGNKGGYDFDLQKALSDPKGKETLMTWAEREVAAGLKGKNQELLEKLTGYKIKLEDGSEEYIDPEKAKQAITFMDTEGKDINEKVEKAVSEAHRKAEAQLESVNSKLSDTEKALQQSEAKRVGTIVNYELKSALLEAGIKPGKLPMHQMYLQSMVAVETDDKGREMVVIKDEKGDLRYGKDGPMKLREFIDEYRDSDDIADDFVANNSGGSGGVKGDPVRGGRGIDQNLTPQERLRQFRAANARQQSRR